MKLVPTLARLQRLALAAGLLAAFVCAIGIALGSLEGFFQSYLYAYIFWLGIALGSLALTMLHYLVGGRWGYSIRRIVEAGARSVWLMAILFIPLVLGLRYLYPWARPEEVAASLLLQHKSPYLNVPFFILRAAIYFALWTGLAFWLTRLARRPETDLDPARRRILQRMSAFGLMIYVLTMTFASIDWIMSLQPEWVSSIFGFLIVAEQALASLAFSIALLPLLTRQEPLEGYVTPDLSRDLGALLLSTVTFWAYLAFFQLLIIWAGNLPREVTWYVDRSNGGWLWVGLLVVLVQFILPFLVLLSLRAKRNLRILSALASGIVVANLVNTFWEILPTFRPSGLAFHWLDFVTPIAIGGVWIAAFLWHLEHTPLMIPAGHHEVSPYGTKETAA